MNKKRICQLPKNGELICFSIAFGCDYARISQQKLISYLGYEGISTHSFRKWYATEICRSSGYDIALVRRLLQHSSAAVT